MHIPAWIKTNLEDKKAHGNFRVLTSSHYELASNFGSNDYLALATHPEVVSALNQSTSVGACCSRLAGGNCEASSLLEQELAQYFCFESALLFSSGFLANLGLLSNIVRSEDIVFSDKYIHASLIEGVRLANCKHYRFKHNDLEHLESFLVRENQKRNVGQHFYIVVESLYSMNGDSPDLIQLSALSKKYNCTLIIDEAHAVGVFANGLSSAISKDNVIITATCSKAFGTYGGFICGPSWLKEFLINSSRSLIYNTALPHALIKATRKSLEVIAKNKNLGVTLLDNAKFFREKLSLASMGYGQIVSIELPSSEAATDLSKKLQQAGFFVPAIRPPTVRQPLLRISISLHHKEDNLIKLSQILNGLL